MLKFIFSVMAGIGTGMVIAKLGSITMAILSGFAGFIIVWRVLKFIAKRLNKKQKDSEKWSDPEEISKEYSERQKKAVELAEEGMSRILKIRNMTRMIRDNEVAFKIQDICRVGVDIFDDLKKNPEDIKKAKPFINYYLDSTDKIISRYVELNNKTDRTPEIEESMKKVEEMLDAVKETFEKQRASLLEDDLLDLNVEISVLEKTMKYEQ